MNDYFPGDISNKIVSNNCEDSGDIARLTQEIRERDGDIARLTQEIRERDGDIARLTQEIRERDGDIAGLTRTINNLFASISWRTTAPLRWVKDISLQFVTKNISPKSFAADLYLQRYPDVAASGMDPLEHYQTFGKNEGRILCVPSLFGRILSQWLAILAAIQQAGGIRQAIRTIFSLVKQHGLGEIFRVLLAILKNLPIKHLHTPTDPDFCATIYLDRQNRYQIGAGSGEYTYIPPRRPPNFELQLTTLQHHTFFSILVPMYDTPSDLLRKLLDSVFAQWYPYWELILVDDASPGSHVQADMAKMNDPRIVAMRLPDNLGIAGASNAALKLAKGDFVVLLDHDDELTVDCLFELAQCIDLHNPDYLYSDEDKIGLDGRFVEPHFKPDWSPDTLMSTMYVCHVSCIRRSVLETLGGFRSDYDGCQDWDLILRLSEKTQRIAHIPKVLYHWRIIPASIAGDIAAKPYVLDASKRVREDALQRRGLQGSVEAIAQIPGYFHINYAITKTPLISIIIPSRDNCEVLHRCLQSIKEQSSYRNFEIIILDNGSIKAETRTYLHRIHGKDNVEVIRHDAPFNFSELNNLGATYAKGDLLLFLNDDTEVLTNDWLERLGGYASLSHIGAVGAKLLYPGGAEIQHAGIVNLSDGPGHAFLRKNAETPCYYMRNLIEYNWIAVTGACLMIERKKFLSVGRFNENFPIAYNDIDLCFRLYNSGLYNIVCQAVRLIHHESVSRGVDHLDIAKNARLKNEKLRLYDAHPRLFQRDPFHNPNLHPNSINFDLAL